MYRLEHGLQVLSSKVDAELRDLKQILLHQYGGRVSESRDLDHLGVSASYSTVPNVVQDQTDCNTGSDEYQDATDDLESKAFLVQPLESAAATRELCKEPNPGSNVKHGKNESGDLRWPSFLQRWSSLNVTKGQSRHRSGTDVDDEGYSYNGASSSKMNFQASISKSSGKDLTCLMGGQNSVFVQDSENPSNPMEFSFRKNIRQVR